MVDFLFKCAVVIECCTPFFELAQCHNRRSAKLRWLLRLISGAKAGRVILSVVCRSIGKIRRAVSRIAARVGFGL